MTGWAVPTLVASTLLLLAGAVAASTRGAPLRPARGLRTLGATGTPDRDAVAAGLAYYRYADLAFPTASPGAHVA